MNLETLIELQIRFVDMGNTLPLRQVVRPFKGKAVYPLLGLTLFMVLPFFSWFYGNAPKPSTGDGDVIAFILLIDGFFLAYLAQTLTDKIEFKITASEAKVTSRLYFRRWAGIEPLSNYAGLWVLVLDIKRFRFGRSKELHQIYLVHRNQPEKDVLLFSRKGDKVWQERLQTYQRLLGLPVLDEHPRGFDVNTPTWLLLGLPVLDRHPQNQPEPMVSTESVDAPQTPIPPSESWPVAVTGQIAAPSEVAATSNAKPYPSAPDADIRQLAADQTEFALAFYRCCSRSGNLCFSPYSLSSALALAYAGARGQTAEEIAKVLHFDLPPSRLHAAFGALRARLTEVQHREGVTLAVANDLWPQQGYPLLDVYRELCRICYGVEITPVDYHQPVTAAATINDWVATHTQRQITTIADPAHFDDLTRLVLASAIYFKGTWKNRFEANETRFLPFWLQPGHSLETPTMTQTATFGYAETPTAQILRLPYVGEDYSMIILLPRKIDGLAELEDALTVEMLQQWLINLQEQEIQVFLPRFKLANRFNLLKFLGSMGMVKAFSNTEADFSGIDGGQPGPLFIGVTIHASRVAVDEVGTIATAATMIVAIDLCMPPPSPIFRADHPFLFLLQEDKSGILLFFGRMINPCD